MGFFTSLFNTSDDEEKRQEAILKEFEERELIELNKTIAGLDKREKLISEYLKLLDEDKYEQALESINFAIKSMPDESAFYIQKSFCLRQLDRFDEALEVLDYALNRFPEEKTLLDEVKAEIFNELIERQQINSL